LRRAAALVGGEQELALRIQVTPSHLILWLAGVVVPPADVFLRAVDIVMDHVQPASAERTP
jgi:DNA-binding transcriptional regulator YdaS (Cro superfamily)